MPAHSGIFIKLTFWQGKRQRWMNNIDSGCGALQANDNFNRCTRPGSSTQTWDVCGSAPSFQFFFFLRWEVLLLGLPAASSHHGCWPCFLHVHLTHRRSLSLPLACPWRHGASWNMRQHAPREAQTERSIRFGEWGGGGMQQESVFKSFSTKLMHSSTSYCITLTCRTKVAWRNLKTEQNN